jgi:hypothetical protein
VIHVTALAHVKHGATHESHWLFAWFGYVPESQFEPLTHVFYNDKNRSVGRLDKQLVQLIFEFEQVAHGDRQT